jgi:hypothetical protein
VVVDSSGAHLCRPAATRLPVGAAARCSPISVPLVGVDTSRLPGVQLAQNVAFTGSVVASGTWNGSALAVNAIEPDQAEPALPDLPCAGPPQSWLPSAGPLDEEAAAVRVNDEVLHHPDIYSGSWAASLPGASGNSALVVGTVGDLAAVQQRLDSIAASPVCVVGVAYSRTTLDTTALQIASSNPSWKLSISAPLDRVTVALPVVTSAAASALAPYPQATFDPLIYVAAR